MGNYPDGCTQADVDRAAGGDGPECAGRVTCHAPVEKPGDLCAECAEREGWHRAAVRIARLIAAFGPWGEETRQKRNERMTRQVEVFAEIIREEMGCPS